MMQKSSIGSNALQDGSVTRAKLAFRIPEFPEDMVYGAAGDSITEGAGLTDFIAEDDPFRPLAGTRKANYAYYISRRYGMSWINYGVSGSTLGDVTVSGIGRNGFTKEGGRYTKLADGLTHITVFFGWNDGAYGHVMKKEDWLKSRYGNTIYWPSSQSLIGTTHADGTPYATQEQYEELMGVTGEVGGKTYQDADSYFKALYIGTSTDTGNKTFWGAWNILLTYLIDRYPLAKIVPIVPYGTSAAMRQCVRDAARKYGLQYFDFTDGDGQLFFQFPDTPPDGYTNATAIANARKAALLKDGCHPNADGYRYMASAIGAKLMGV